MSEQQKKYWGVHWVENLQMDNKLRLKQIVLWIFAFLWLTFCFYLSWQTGEETVGLSLQIARWCYDLLSKLHFTVELESLHSFPSSLTPLLQLHISTTSSFMKTCALAGTCVLPPFRLPQSQRLRQTSCQWQIA